MSNYGNRQPRGFVSKAEMLLWMKEKRYRGTDQERDPAYVHHVEECLMLTDEAILGLPTPQVAPPMQQYLQQGRETVEGLRWQDPQGTLAQKTDVYRDMTECAEDMRSAKYKASAFYRQQVHEKINRSTPDSSVDGGEKWNGSVQMMSEPEVHPWTSQQEEEGN